MLGVKLGGLNWHVVDVHCVILRCSELVWKGIGG